MFVVVIIIIAVFDILFPIIQGKFFFTAFMRQKDLWYLLKSEMVLSTKLMVDQVYLQF